ncbi:early growth response protein 1-like isoform X2 [Dysidea avara]
MMEFVVKEPCIVPDGTEEIEVTKDCKSNNNANQDPHSHIDFSHIDFSHIDFSNPENIFDFSAPYSSRTTTSPPNTPTLQMRKARKLIAQPPMNMCDVLNSPEYKKEAEKKFPCDICGRRFARSSHMRRHQRIHSGEKPYNCHICKRPFARYDYVESHILSHRRNKVHSCFVCGEVYHDLVRFSNHCQSHSDSEYLKAARIKEAIKSRKLTSAKKVQNATEPQILASSVQQEIHQPCFSQTLPEDDSEESIICMENRSILVLPAAVHPLHYSPLPCITLGPQAAVSNQLMASFSAPIFSFQTHPASSFPVYIHT